MGFLATTKAFFAAVKTKTFQLLGFATEIGLGTGGPGSPTEARNSKYNAGKWLKTYRSCTDLKQPIQKLAQDVAAVRFYLGRIVGTSTDGTLLVKKVHKHRFLDLWKRPNFMMSTDQFVELGMTWLEVTGRWATFIERDAAGLPSALWPITPTDLLKMPTRERPQWRFRLNGKTLEKPAADVIWICYIDPENPYGWGASPCESVADEVAQIQYANKWNLNHFRQGTHLGKIIGVPGLNAKNGPAMQADHDARFKGIENAHKVMYVGTGTDAAGKLNPNISVIELGKSHKEMDYKDILDFLSDKVAGNWGMPRTILGRSGNANRSEGDNDEKRYQANSVEPRAGFLQEQLQLQLVGEFGEEDLWLGYEDPVAESRQFNLEQHNDGLAHCSVSINEWRKSQGKEPFGAIGDCIIVPLNSVVVPTNITPDNLVKLLGEHTNSGGSQPTTLSLSVGGNGKSNGGLVHS